MDNQQIEIVKVFNLLRIAYPYIERDRSPDDIQRMIDLYVDQLSSVDINQLKIAARQVIAESRFFPTVAELRERVLSFRQLAANVPDWSQAWEDVQLAIRRYGYEEGMERGLHVFSHEHIETAVRRVGWRDICFCDLDQINTLRAQFRDTYNAIVKREEQVDRLLPEARLEIMRLADNLDINRRRALPPEQEATNGSH